MFMKKNDYRWVRLINGDSRLVTVYQEIQIKKTERNLRIEILLGDT